MKLHILDSGSKANGYILEGANEALILEAGVSIDRVAKALNYQNKAKAVLVTHEHGDHAMYAYMYATRFPLLATSGTLNRLGLENSGKAIQYGKTYSVGGFRFLPFATEHDAEQPCGFVINHAECGNILFATDTYLIAPKVENLNHLLMECNYCEERLTKNYKEGILPTQQYRRVLYSHMGLASCLHYADSYKEDSLISNIILLHGSKRNCDEDLIKKEFSEKIGILPKFARPNTTINLDLIPF